MDSRIDHLANELRNGGKSPTDECNTLIDQLNHDGKKVWAENLPISKEDVDKLVEYRHDFERAFEIVAKEALHEAVNSQADKKDVPTNAFHQLRTDDVDYNAYYSAPSSQMGEMVIAASKGEDYTFPEPSKEQVDNNTSTAMTVPSLNSVSEVTEALMKHWDMA